MEAGPRGRDVKQSTPTESSTLSAVAHPDHDYPPELINRPDSRIRLEGVKRSSATAEVSPMKTYRVSRLYRWSRFGAKVVLTGLGEFSMSSP